MDSNQRRLEVDGILGEYLRSGHADLPFEDLELAGRGEFSEVYKARCKDKGVPVALKFLKIGLQDAYRLFAFDREVEIHKHLIGNSRVLALLSGQRVLEVPIAVAGTQRGMVLEAKYFGVDWYPHTVLRLLSRRERPFSEMLRLFHDVVLGVKQMHEAGVCHRDLKPDNLLVSEDGSRAVVGDLGTASRGSDGDSFPGADAYKWFWQGATHYVAPERFAGAGSFGDCITADVYSLGCVLFEVATGLILYDQIEDAIAYLVDINAKLRAMPGEAAIRLAEASLRHVEASFALPRIAMHSGLPGPETRNFVEDLYHRLCRFRPVDRLRDLDQLLNLVRVAISIAEKEEERRGRAIHV